MDTYCLDYLIIIAVIQVIGRRIFLIVDSIGIAFAMLISIISSDIILYVIGCAPLIFFAAGEIQDLYLMETFNKDNRGKLCLITKGIALISVSLLGVLVKLFVQRDKTYSWRFVYIIPLILTIIVIFALIYYVKETPGI